MTEAQKVKFTRFNEVKEKITKYLLNALPTIDSNSNFYYEELSNLYYTKNNTDEHLSVLLEGRDDINIPLYCINQLDMTNILNFLDSHINRLAIK